MTDKACGRCRHATPANLVSALECHAHPPTPDVGRYARFPLVRPEEFCGEFDADPTVKAPGVERQARAKSPPPPAAPKAEGGDANDIREGEAEGKGGRRDELQL
jgi:hypothetical protein